MPHCRDSSKVADRISPHKTGFVSIYLPLLWRSKPMKSLVCYGCKAEAKNWWTYYLRGPGSFPVTVASCRSNISPVRAGQRVWLILLQGSEELTHHSF
jgi:hypothetical protein